MPFRICPIGDTICECSEREMELLCLHSATDAYLYAIGLSPNQESVDGMTAFLIVEAKARVREAYRTYETWEQVRQVMEGDDWADGL